MSAAAQLGLWEGLYDRTFAKFAALHPREWLGPRGDALVEQLGYIDSVVVSIDLGYAMPSRSPRRVRHLTVIDGGRA